MADEIRMPTDRPVAPDRIDRPERIDRPDDLAKRWVDDPSDIFSDDHGGVPDWVQALLDHGCPAPAIVEELYADNAGDILPIFRFDLDREISPGLTAREALRSYDPTRASLPQMSFDEAAAYIKQHQEFRPWLRAVADHDPEVQRVYATQDQGQSNALRRHDGYGADEDFRRRASDSDDLATRIHDPDAFATAFARGVEHPTVRTGLERPYSPGFQPTPVQVPIVDLLGDDGHRYCSGYQRTESTVDDGARARPIPSFADWTVEFRFLPNKPKDGYEIATMFPQQPV